MIINIHFQEVSGARTVKLIYFHFIYLFLAWLQKNYLYSICHNNNIKQIIIIKYSDNDEKLVTNDSHKNELVKNDSNTINTKSK